MWLKGTKYIVAAIVVALAVIIAGFVLSPNLQKQTPTATTPPSAPSNPGSGTGSGGSGGGSGSGSGGGGGSGTGNSGSNSAPTWAAGDYWKYNVTVDQSTMTAQTASDSPSVRGTVTKTVTGTESTPAGNAYNVSVSGSFVLNDTFSTMTGPSSAYQAASVSGYVLYRTSDLARVRDAYTVRLNGSATYYNQTITYSYVAKVWASFDPALALWQFPLEENRTWNATSNVSAGYWSQTIVSYGNRSYTSNRSWNATFVLDLLLHSGVTSSVTVPAGTFDAIPVSVYAGSWDDLSDRAAGEIMNFTGFVEMPPSAGVAQLWYSGTVGNVVKATGAMGPWDSMSVEADLVAYKYP